jgi:NADH:ubiquinone oxidoreductase subunit 4 (subunit M)
MIYERRHTYEISEFGGLASTMPIYATSSSFHRAGLGEVCRCSTDSSANSWS